MKLIHKLATGSVVAFLSATTGHAQGLDERLAFADVVAGESLYRQCKTCHLNEKGAANRTGPNLYGIVGREVAAVGGFRYSPAMIEFGGEWTPERLDAFLENPRGTVPRTRMSFRGIASPEDRAHIIAYLNAHSDEPLELANEAQGEEAPSADRPADEDFGQLVLAEGVEDTFYACTPCHSEMIVVQQGKTREGWDKLLDWMIEEQGMAEYSDDERAVILDYLATHYNTDRPNFPRQ